MTDKEFKEEVFSRAEKITQKKRQRKYILYGAVSSAAMLALVFGIGFSALFLPAKGNLSASESDAASGLVNDISQERGNLVVADANGIEAILTYGQREDIADMLERAVQEGSGKSDAAGEIPSERDDMADGSGDENKEFYVYASAGNYEITPAYISFNGKKLNLTEERVSLIYDYIRSLFEEE